MTDSDDFVKLIEACEYADKAYKIDDSVDATIARLFTCGKSSGTALTKDDIRSIQYSIRSPTQKLSNSRCQQVSWNLILCH